MISFYKLCLIALITCYFSFELNATTVVVNVEDFEFGPGDFSINLGDTVIWSWDNSAGAHTTTSTTIPAGAAVWDQPINASSQTYMYIPTVAGSYSYICSIHPTLMQGHFDVIGTAGNTPIESTISMFLTGIHPLSNEIELTYTVPQTSELAIRMYDNNGKLIRWFETNDLNAGIYTQKFILTNRSAGMYYFTLETQDRIILKKIFIQ